MKLQFFLLAGSAAISCINGLDATCPDQYCANEVVNTEPTVDSSVDCPGLKAVKLLSYIYEDNPEVLIELRGPEYLADAADLVITAPHGGDLKPSYVTDRSTNDQQYCPSSGCKTVADSKTKEISELLQQKFIENFCKVPFLVINHLHREKLDANRAKPEAAQDDPVAEAAWLKFHTFINDAQVMLRTQFGTSTTSAPGSDPTTGINALLLDIHGYTGYDWKPKTVPPVLSSYGGSPLIQWGFRLSADSSLETCPLLEQDTGTIGTMTHARWMVGHSYECLVRGPGSLASRVSNLLDAAGFISGYPECGEGLPSNEHPSPQTMRNDPLWCDANPDTCYYYNGGYDVKVHERMDWENESNLGGDHMNTIQAEFPRCIRLGGNAVREELADKLSVATMSFLRDLYGDMPAPAP